MKYKTRPGAYHSVVDLSTKTVAVEFKADRSGRFSAVIASLNVIDSDKDVTLPGAFGVQDVAISAYGHASWGAAMPVGRGTTRETRDEAIVDGKFFTNTTAGRETFELVREMGPLQQWS